MLSVGLQLKKSHKTIYLPNKENFLPNEGGNSSSKRAIETLERDGREDPSANLSKIPFTHSCSDLDITSAN